MTLAEVVTPYKDKSGKNIHLDDLVQHQLGKFAKSKSNGPSRFRVMRSGKKINLVPEAQSNDPKAGFPITEKIAEYLVVIDCRHLGMR